MTQDPRPAASLFTQVDISPGSHTEETDSGSSDYDQTRLLRQILAAQDRQNDLLEEVVSQLGSAISQISSQQRQRAQELGQWKQANPQLSQHCRRAAETLSKVQTEFLTSITDEVTHNADALMDGEFMLNEFVDRFGPRLAHLNGVLQVLSQLGATPSGGK